MKKFWVVFFLWMGGTIWGFSTLIAAPVIIVNEDQIVRNAGLQMTFLEDSEAALHIQDVLRRSDFSQIPLKVPNFQISSSAWWIKIPLKNQTSSNRLTIEISSPILDSVSLFVPTKDGKYVEQLSGDHIPFSQRPEVHRNIQFSFDIPVGEQRELFLRVRSQEQVVLPIQIAQPRKLLIINSQYGLFHGFYFGIVVVMLLYNLFVFLSVRDKSYGWYVFYILFIGLTQSSDFGYNSFYLWPEWIEISNLMVVVFPALVGSAAIMFMREFMQTIKHTPWSHRILGALIYVYAVCIIIFLFGARGIAYQMLQITAMTVSLVALITAIKIASTGFRPAIFFLIAWTVFLASVVMFVLKDFGALPYNIFTQHILMLGSAIEIVLLSIALADRINTLKNEKEASQQREIRALQENEKLIREQNMVLDQKVRDRTFELQQSNQELEKAMVDLKEAQSQLVNAEKMASLGVLTAGIAHEINNPINFVVANINPLKRDIDDLYDVIQRIETMDDEGNLSDQWKVLKQYIQDIDLDFTRKEIDELLQGMDEGARRTAEIVQSLKTFSRHEETELKEANINECIEATLLLIKHSFKQGIRLHKSFAELPLVACLPGKLNQLLMNILKNAIHAVEDKHYESGESPEICVVTEEIGGDVIIRIKDNGVGMSSDTLSRIYEPFFTTKPVGKGTGLGLSIAYNIIEAHCGYMDVISELNYGTEFIIALPNNLDQWRKESPDKLENLRVERKKLIRKSLDSNLNAH